MDNPEKDMNRFVDNWVHSTLPSIASSQDFQHERQIAIIARLAMDRPHEDIDQYKKKRPLLLRIQSRIDAVTIEAMATGKTDTESTRQLADWINNLGYERIAHKLFKSLTGDTEHQLEVLGSIASSHCQEIANRTGENRVLINRYMHELNYSAPELFASSPSKKRQAPLQEQGLSMT